MRKMLDSLKSATGKLALAGTAVMATAGTALAQLDTGSVRNLEIKDMDLMDLVEQIVNGILVFVGIIAVLYLIYGGVTYVTAGGDAEKAGKGRVTITNAIIGVIIIVASLAIYNYVIGDLAR